MHLIYLIHEFHSLSRITEINLLSHDILIYWDAPIFSGEWVIIIFVYFIILCFKKDYFNILLYLLYLILTVLYFKMCISA